MFLICAGLLAVRSWQEFGDKPASSIQAKADHDKLLATKTIARFSAQLATSTGSFWPMSPSNSKEFYIWGIHIFFLATSGYRGVTDWSLLHV